MRNVIVHIATSRLRTWLTLGLCYAVCVVGPSQIAFSQAAQKVRVLGNYSNVKPVGDDAFGYSLQLWKEGNRIFGLFAVYTGAPADPPVGILENVQFDPHTRQLSFSARLSTGVRYIGPDSRSPTRDRFSFSGVLTAKEVTGTLIQTDELVPQNRPTSSRIRLRWSSSLTQVLTPPPATYSEWKSWADEILRRRGPRW